MSLSRSASAAIVASLLATSGLAQNASGDDSLNLRFANGIVAIAEDKVITVDDVRREINPLLPQLNRESRNEQEFNQKLEALQDLSLIHI